MTPLIQSGKANKPNVGSLTITFDTAYSQAPQVMLTPFWEGQNKQVGNIATLTTVTGTGFTLTSNNWGSDYFVNWMAFGQRA